jgi:glycosyltransferase involved in cell wall biosynthesis
MPQPAGTARAARAQSAVERPADLGSSRLRLTKFVTAFEPGGTERQFVNLGLALDPDRFALRFGCLSRRGSFLEALEARGVPTREYPITSFLSAGYPGQALRLARDLARDRVQVVHTYGFYGNVFAVPAARAAGVPVVIASIRDRGVYLTPNQQRVQRYVCRLADSVLVNADSVKEWLVEDGYDPSKIVVIRNGIDMSGYDGRAPRVHGRPDGGTRREFGVPASAPLVAVVGRINPSKGLEYFLQAAARVHQRHPDARFLIVGGGPDVGYRASLENSARTLGLADRVIFAGHRSDLPRIISDVTVSVLSSLSEAMPNAVLESMAAGVPVVATRVGGVPEAVEDGMTGLLVPPADAASLAAAVSRVLENPALALRLGRAGQQAVRTRFSMARMVESTEQLYWDLLARKERRAHRVARRPSPGVPSHVIAEKKP